MNRRRLVMLIAALGSAALLAGCSSAVPLNDPVYARMAKLQLQVKKLQKRINGHGLMGMASDQQQLNQQVASLQGQIQDLEHQVAQMQRHERDVDQNFDQRLTVLEGGTPTGFQGAQTSGSGAATGHMNTGSQNVPTPPPPAPSSAAGSTVSAGANGVGNNAGYSAYQAAFGKLRAGDNAGAIAAFDKFIKAHPNSRYVPNAWYWMAETHYVNGQYKDAIKDFQQVVQKYPKSSKAADSQLKIGYAQYALGDQNSARETFQAVIKKYPGTTPADLAKQRLKKMGSSG